MNDYEMPNHIIVEFHCKHTHKSQPVPSLHVFIVCRTQKGFVTGETPKDDVPVVFIGPKDDKFNLVIYRVQDTTCIFLVEPSSITDASFSKNLGTFISHQIDFLSPILEEHYAKKHKLNNIETPAYCFSALKINIGMCILTT